jgi:hypothetical protein
MSAEQVWFLDSPDVNLHAKRCGSERGHDKAFGALQNSPAVSSSMPARIGFRTTENSPDVTRAVLSPSATPTRQESRICSWARTVTTQPTRPDKRPATPRQGASPVRHGSRRPVSTATGPAAARVIPPTSKTPPNHSTDPLLPERPRKPWFPVRRYWSHVRKGSAARTNPAYIARATVSQSGPSIRAPPNSCPIRVRGSGRAQDRLEGFVDRGRRGIALPHAGCRLSENAKPLPTARRAIPDSILEKVRSFAQTVSAEQGDDVHRVPPQLIGTAELWSRHCRGTLRGARLPRTITPSSRAKRRICHRVQRYCCRS